MYCAAWGIVGVPQQQEPVDGRANFVRRSFHQAELDVAWRILDPVKVARELSLWGEHHDASGMRKLPLGRVVGITEAYGLGQALDGLRRASEKVPTASGISVGRIGTAVAPRVLCLPGCRQSGRIGWIDTHGQHVEMRPNGQRECP